MKTKQICFFFISILLIFKPIVGHSCTTFFLDQGVQYVFGRNYDFPIGDGLAVVNKRDVKKEGYSNTMLTWTSKYGSVTFNQFGREFPMGGMNETGLVVESMALEKTKYPKPDSRNVIEMAQWIQYQLDSFSSVEEVLSSNSKIRIRPISNAPGVHFFVCDKSKACAVIEFIENKMVFYKNSDLPVKALTNDTYADSINGLESNHIPQPDKFKSIERFIDAANMVRAHGSKSDILPVDYAFSILDSASLPPFTQWTIVYNIPNLTIHFRTSNSLKIRHFSLKSFDFSCKTPVKIIDINNKLSGDISTQFDDYAYEMNLSILTPGFRFIMDQIVGRQLAENDFNYLLEHRAGYSMRTECTEE